jgi:arylsulfatase
VYFQRTDKNLSRTATLGEVLQPAGYVTLWSGKHHATFSPVSRGYDHFYGMLGGCENHFNPGSRAIAGQPTPTHKNNGNRWVVDGTEVDDYTPSDHNFYDTDAFTDRALQWLDEYEKGDRPFLLSMAYTAPHWPLQARPEDIARYKGVYDGGYDVIRKARYERQIKLGLVDPRTSPLPPMEYEKTAAKKWDALLPDERKQEVMKMEVYAAMLDRVDQNIGRLVKRLEEQEKLDDTLILFFRPSGRRAMRCHLPPATCVRSPQLFPSLSRQGNGAGIPPLVHGKPSARWQKFSSTVISVLSGKSCTDPSQKTNCAPPGCRLLKLKPLETSLPLKLLIVVRALP